MESRASSIDGRWTVAARSADAVEHPMARTAAIRGLV
jgi:hypothetical protein